MSYDGFISYSHAADGLLAPRLQAGLQRFAKPWWQRRALRIFRDESSLSANPHLWSSITEALDESEWFVLLLSPDAADSEWVNQEVAYWVEHKDPSRILPVVTAGEFGWADGDVAGEAVPDALRGVFAEEPRWVDMRWAREEDQLDLQDPRFADAVADIASAIRGVPKDDLASEEVRQHRRTVRTAWAAGAIVAVLAIAAAWFGIDAGNERNRADEEAARATAAAEQEAEARELAEANAQEAERNASLARARELAAAAQGVREDDPELAMLLGLAALRESPEGGVPIEIGESFRRSLYALNAVSRVPVPGGESVQASALSPDGTRLAVLSTESVTVRVLDTSTWQEVWTYSEDSPDFADWVYFSTDGSEVVFTVSDSSTSGFDAPFREGEEDDRWARVVFLDAETGEQRVTHEFDGECPGVLIGSQSPNGRWWPVISSDDPLCDEFGSWVLSIFDAETFRPIRELGPATPGTLSWSNDSSRLAFNSFWGQGIEVYDVATGALVMDSEADVFQGVIDGPGERVAAATGLSGMVSVFDTDTGIEVDRLEALSDWPQSIAFSEDGSLVFAGSRGEGAAVWSMESGRTLHRLGGISSVWGMHYLDAEERVHVVGSEEIVTYDLGGDLAGESSTEQWGEGLQANGFAVTGSVGSALVAEEGTFDWEVVAFDADTGSLMGASADVELSRKAEVLPDGRIVLFRREGSGPDRLLGPVEIWDPSTDSYQYLVGCQIRATLIESTEAGTAADCAEDDREWFDASMVHFHVESNLLLVSDFAGRVLLFDADSLELVDDFQLSGDPRGGIEEYGGDWVAVSSGSPALADVELAITALPSQEVIAVIPGGISALSPDQRRLAVGDGRGGYTIYDTTSWEPVGEGRAGDARVRGMAFSPSGEKLMTSGTDDVVRIWDAEAGVELDRIPLTFASDAHWLDEDRLYVSFEDKFTVVSLDLEEVAEIAIDRLTRGLTDEECTVYRLDPCPTLEELRGES